MFSYLDYSDDDKKNNFLKAKYHVGKGAILIDSNEMKHKTNYKLKL